MLDFKTLSILMAAVAFALFGVLLLAPELIFKLFSIQENQSAFFISRRASMLFLGIAVLCWFGRGSANSLSRQAVCIGLAVSMFSLALLVLIEYFRGYVGGGIMIAVITEAFMGMNFLVIWLSNRHN